MITSHTPILTCGGVELDQAPECFGELRDSSAMRDDPNALRAQLAEDGYLFLPGLLDNSAATDIRMRMLEQLAADDLLDPAYPLAEGVLRKEGRSLLNTEKLRSDLQIRQFLFSGTLVDLMVDLQQESILHFDFIWFRAVGKGHGTKPHCDFPYMGRGTFNLLTAWVPYGRVPLETGGLMILEGSHKVTPSRCKRYLSRDVDSHCINKPRNKAQQNGWSFDGTLSNNACTLREKLGGRWLTASYHPGDVLLFGMGTVHASLDNQTNHIRLSTDTRYQPASETADDRWIGQEPIGHGRDAKRYLIC